MENSKKAFAYLRVSSIGQIPGDGFPRQREAITHWAATHGVTITRWFEEKGISGKTDLENRPALDELFRALNANGVKVVLIERLDRLGRELMVQENLLAQFVKQGFEIISVTEPSLCDDDATRVLIRQMLGAIGQFDRTRIVEKLKAARQRKRIQTGSCEGRKAFGAREGEQASLDRMINLNTFGSNYEQIARELNAAGTMSRSGKPWRPATIRRILLVQQRALRPKAITQ
jgi:DNA invertase Pin-like site-specific DNA recombinase